jgi:hypothetical protein
MEFQRDGHIRLAIRLLSLTLALPLSTFSQSRSAAPQGLAAATGGKAEQPLSRRFWIAGRYDGNRVIVYFDAVKFNNTVPSVAERLPNPVADGFLMPEKLPWAYVAKLQEGPDTEHFKIGDKYDLLFGSGKVAPITLTMTVGTEGDEGVGNDSYIGALATLDDKDGEFLLSKNYYVVYRHGDLADLTRPRRGACWP